MMEGPKKYTFKSSATGAEFVSENPIDAGARRNTLFVEKLKFLTPGLNNLVIQNINSSFLKAGPEGLDSSEKMLNSHQKRLPDLLNILNRHPQEQRDLEGFIADFFSLTNPKDKEARIGFIANLI